VSATSNSWGNKQGPEIRVSEGTKLNSSPSKYSSEHRFSVHEFQKIGFPWKYASSSIAKNFRGRNAGHSLEFWICPCKNYDHEVLITVPNVVKAVSEKKTPVRILLYDETIYILNGERGICEIRRGNCQWCGDSDCNPANGQSSVAMGRIEP